MCRIELKYTQTHTHTVVCVHGDEGKCRPVQQRGSLFIIAFWKIMELCGTEEEDIRFSPDLLPEIPPLIYN